METAVRGRSEKAVTKGVWRRVVNTEGLKIREWCKSSEKERTNPSVLFSPQKAAFSWLENRGVCCITGERGVSWVRAVKVQIQLIAASFWLFFFNSDFGACKKCRADSSGDRSPLFNPASPQVRKLRNSHAAPCQYASNLIRQTIPVVRA